MKTKTIYSGNCRAIHCPNKADPKTGFCKECRKRLKAK